MKNKVYLVGAGPGSPDLITVRGREVLRHADVVIYDYLVDKRLLDEAKDGAELVCCDTLGNKRHSDGFLIHQDRIDALVAKKAKENKRVVRLKNGDPSIFSRAGQELNSLVKNRIEFEIVPGVGAANAAAALSGIPLTDRKLASSCVFVTGHEDPAKPGSSLDWASLGRAGTIVLYMAVENFGKITDALIAAGRPEATPVAIIENVSLPTQRLLTGTLADIAKTARKKKVKAPAIVIIGDVVKLEKKFNWLMRMRRVLFTGISPERFFERGVIFHLPLIKIVPLNDCRALEGALKNIAAYDWLVFSSRYGVLHFFQALNKIGYDARALAKAKVAAIGNSTKARLLDFGILADVVPKDESARGLINEFKRVDIKGKRIFMPRSDLSDKGLKEGLESQGAIVDAVVAYRNIIPQGLPELDIKSFDEVIFTSPSTVRNFKKRYGALPRGIKVKCIGDVTQREFRRCKM